VTPLAGPGIEVVPLAFHVDYWNRLGWRDPFSSVEWSLRQSRYAQIFDSNRVYTPQVVIDGRFETVGSDRRSILRLLDTVRRGPVRTRIGLAATFEGDLLEIEVETEGLERGSGVLHLAIVESGLVTEVERGENARRTLRNDHVVRRFETLRSSAFEIPIDPRWERENLAVVAFLQDPGTLEILGVGRVRPRPL
jgi:hypothetical protein